MAAPILLIGDGDLADEVRAALDELGADVIRLVEPAQREVEAVFARDTPAKAVVVSSDDAYALRMALMVRDADEDVELLVTYFDTATAAQLTSRIEHLTITSLADIVAPVLAGPALDEKLGAVRIGDDGHAVGVTVDGDEVTEKPLQLPRRQRGRALLRALLKPYDRSAALMFYGAIGLLAILVTETIAASIVLDQKIIDAFYGSAKTLATVDPNDKVTGGPGWFKVFTSIIMLVALALEAFFTAGLVNRLIDRRLTGLVGRRAVPRRDHVVVVGMGQVGLRLAMLLRDLGVGVVAVDDREDGENVGVAREAGLPVVIGRGADPSLLRRLSLKHACAVAAVTDDDLENVSIAMAARSVEDDVRVVLRVGDGRLANETRSLFRLGPVRDVHRIAAALLAAQATGSSAQRVVCVEEHAHLVHEDGKAEEAAFAAAT